jgi:hypothetical protein
VVVFVLLMAHPAARGAARSARTDDPVPALRQALAAPPSLRPARAIERAGGDLLLGVFADADHAVRALLRVLQLPGWVVGLGAGDLDQPLPLSVHEVRGPGLEAARAALVRARSGTSVPVAVAAGQETADDLAAEAEAVLRLVGFAVRRRSAGQARLARLVEERPTASQADLAARLGITQQAVSRSLRTGGVPEVRAASEVASRLLRTLEIGAGRRV